MTEISEYERRKELQIEAMKFEEKGEFEKSAKIWEDLGDWYTASDIYLRGGNHKKSVEMEEQGKRYKGFEKDVQEEMTLLKSPDLYDKINRELDKKIQGEYEVRKAIFITANMRNVENLHKATDNLCVNDIGGTGKDHVVSSIFELLPDNEKVILNRISPKVLCYYNDTKVCPEGWTKKALYLEDLPNEIMNDDVFKLMSSANPNGITIQGMLVHQIAKSISIKGKPPIIMTIASASPKQEMLRRYPICNLTSSEDQTKAILKRQGKFAKDGSCEEYNPLIKKALSYLKRVKVKIPFAENIPEKFPSSNVIARTHFPRFLDYMKSSCALHQFQRKQDEHGYYIAEKQDYDIAKEVILSTTTNNQMIPLSKLQRQILNVFSELDREKAYTIQDLEEKCVQLGIGDSWLRRQLDKLTEYGFLKRGNEHKDNSFKPVATYQYSEVLKLELPSFEELGFNENTENSENTPNTPNSPNSS